MVRSVADEEIELALRCLDLGDVDMEVADRIGFERAFFAGLSPSTLGKAADTVALQATMQRRAAQVLDRCLQGVETVIQGQKRVFAKCDDDGLVLD